MGPIESQAHHAVEVMRGHRHLLFSNVKGVGSVPPPLDQCLH